MSYCRREEEEDYFSYLVLFSYFSLFSVLHSFTFCVYNTLLYSCFLYPRFVIILFCFKLKICLFFSSKIHFYCDTYATCAFCTYKSKWKFSKNFIQSVTYVIYVILCLVYNFHILYVSFITIFFLAFFLLFVRPFCCK